MHMCACMLSCFSHVLLFVTLWPIGCQAPLSRGFSKKAYYSGLSWPPSRALLNPGIELVSPASSALQVDYLPTEPRGIPEVCHTNVKMIVLSQVVLLLYIVCIITFTFYSVSVLFIVV